MCQCVCKCCRRAEYEAIVTDKKLAKDLAKIQEQGEETIENADYFKRVFKLDNSKE